jgi:Protein of unknown function (DUF3303)
MLFMVIEVFKDTVAIAQRLQRQGRMLPAGVTYQASWIDPAAGRCFQVMDAPSQAELLPWTSVWADLIDFEIIPVVASGEFWSTRTR